MATMSSATASADDSGKNSISNLLKFFSLVGQIKREKRTGWVNNNVQQVESVSDHMYRMAVMSMMLDAKHVDVTHCIKMALVHDLAECIVGDITPYCGVTPEDKLQREKNAMTKLIELLPDNEIADDIMGLWNEYTQQESGEAKAVKDIDRFEMILQAFEYEKMENRLGDLQSFFSGTQGKFQTDQVKSWVSTLETERAGLLEKK